MSPLSRWEYLRAIYHRYRQADKATRRRILDEFCQVCGYHRKYAIRLLGGPPPQKRKPQRRGRTATYSSTLISILAAIWEAAGYPWSARLKALLPLWLPWAQKRFRLTDAQQRQLRSMSTATIDRRLKSRKRQLKRKLYGRTKPGTLLKHHIPVKCEHWDVTTPGFGEADLVSHSGNCAEGEFCYSLNLTDIHTTWTETRAVMGKGQHGVLEAMQEIRHALPFALHGIDSDNDSAFINYHLKAFCDQQQIQFTRSRPYKKNDNAHVEQKNWTHVRKLMGYLRYDSQEALAAMNDLYRCELRLFYNLYLPSVKLVRKERVGSRLKRVYAPPQSPLERLGSCPQADPHKVAELQRLRDRLDPFELSKSIDRKLERLYQLAHHRLSPLAASTPRVTRTDRPRPLSRIERESTQIISQVFGIPVYVRNSKPPQKP